MQMALAGPVVMRQVGESRSEKDRRTSMVAFTGHKVVNVTLHLMGIGAMDTGGRMGPWIWILSLCKPSRRLLQSA